MYRWRHIFWAVETDRVGTTCLLPAITQHWAIPRAFPSVQPAPIVIPASSSNNNSSNNSSSNNNSKLLLSLWNDQGVQHAILILQMVVREPGAGYLQRQVRIMEVRIRPAGRANPTRYSLLAASWKKPQVPARRPVNYPIWVPYKVRPIPAWLHSASLLRTFWQKTVPDWPLRPPPLKLLTLPSRSGTEVMADMVDMAAVDTATVDTVAA